MSTTNPPEPTDSLKHPLTPDDFADYFEACLQAAGDDAAFIAHALGVMARSHGMARMARHCGISRQGLYKTLSTEGNPSFATILKVVKALELQLHASKAARDHAVAGPPTPRRPRIYSAADNATASIAAIAAKRNTEP